MSEIAPLLPATVDLRSFPYMPLDVGRLRDSGIAASVTGEEFRAAVLLWCAAWHQVPAASLPDNDSQLANLAGFGRVVNRWLKIKSGALRGFQRGTDGRLWHRVIAHYAAEAWNKKQRAEWVRECDRIRKEGKRHGQMLDLPSQPIPISIGCPADNNGMSHGNPPENALNLKETEIPLKPPIVSDGSPADRPRRERQRRANGNGHAQSGQQPVTRETLPVAEPWDARVRAFRASGFWQPFWGPKPGEPGCYAPAHLIAQSTAP